ncbi:hypothetical protein CHS0354_018540 [Potamilus streckersoni]|uniref:phosphoribosyl-AMP cyclohydrolase n=1 Tax=Potamilus streckersoni TaxID=2493646 RepID=A0AAE0WAC1_9BIVA|nr:hypothetical protein CHS0354_018540 [Potamilus streckersoni]
MKPNTPTDQTTAFSPDLDKLFKIAQEGEAVIPAIIQHNDTKDVLMLGYMNRVALKQTMETGRVTFWSTSRRELWVKGATSGNTLRAMRILINCEQNSLLIYALPEGPGVCHTIGNNGTHRPTCYYRELSLYSAEKYRFFADGTLYDSPFVSENGSYTAPSMQQATEVSSNFYQLTHFYLQKLTDNKAGQIAINVIFDALLMPHPIIWLHEEHHRAVMARRGINSRNESYFLYSKLEGGVVKVSGVKDSDLIRLKRYYPPEIIYLHTAGIVSMTAMTRHIESRWFFHETESLDYGILWTNAVNNFYYMSACTQNEEPELPEETEDERDFTGFDCRAWVYDLFRPDEPYETRGIHRSGQGIDRYITYAKLSSEERNYLSNATQLYLLNFIDPNLIGFHRIQVSENFVFNFAGRHSWLRSDKRVRWICILI